MSDSELQATLLQYANEDLDIAESEGAMTICNTKFGLLDIEYKDDKYTVTHDGGVLETMRRSTAAKFVASAYVVEN